MLYAGDDLDHVDLPSTVYGSSTRQDIRPVSIGVPWADFRSTKAAVKMHTLLDLRGNIPSFTSTYPTANYTMFMQNSICCFPNLAFYLYVMDRGYVDFARFACAA